MVLHRHSGKELDTQAIIRETRHQLNARLHDVLSGKRARDFGKQQRLSSDVDLAFTPPIISTHGRYPLVATNHTKHVLQESVISVLQEIELEDALREPSLLILAIRALRLSINFAPCTCTSGLALVSTTFRNKIWYKMLAKCLARSGPAFIKWGQWASTRQDMFPDELCQELSVLHASAPAHSWTFTQRTVEQALGIPHGSILEVFESFDPKPLASGSIAQVHRAVLKPDVTCDSTTSPVMDFDQEHAQDGMAVAIKVRHPMVAELIDWDFRLMLHLADLVDAIPPLRWINLRASVEQFSHTMAAQAHLNVEAHHLELLNYNFRNWPNVGFPRPFFSAPAVICETFEPGRVVTDIIDDYDGQKHIHDHSIISLHQLASVADNIPLDLAEFLVTNGLSIYLKMLLVDNLMHADLHPGNIMCRVNDVTAQKLKRKCDIAKRLNQEKSQLKANSIVRQVGGGMVTKTFQDNSGDKCKQKVNSTKLGDASFDANMILVDAGMVAKLDEEESDNFIGFLASLGEGDGRQAAQAALRFSPGFDLTETQKDAFCIDMENMFAEHCRGYGTNVDVGDILRKVLQLIRTHKVRIDANYATLVINALCIEGLAKRVAPSYNVLDAAQPMLQSYYRICGTGRSKSRIRHSIMRLWMPIMYLRKAAYDKFFFIEQRRKRQQGMTNIGPHGNWGALIIKMAATAALLILAGNLKSMEGLMSDPLQIIANLTQTIANR